MTVFLQEIRWAWRALRRHPGFSATTVLVLSLGIGAAGTMATVVDGVFLRPLGYPEEDRLVAIWETWPAQGIEQAWVSPPNARDWAEQATIFQELAILEPHSNLNLSGIGEPVRVDARKVTPDLFEVLGVAPARGRSFAPGGMEENEGTAVISHALWKRELGGDPRVLGRSIVLDGRPAVVVGVMPEGFAFPAGTEVWIPSSALREDWSRSAHFLEVVGRLEEAVTLRQAQAEMDLVTERLAREYPDTNLGWGARLVPLREQLLGDAEEPATALALAALVVLVMACANAASLAMVRTLARDDELAVRRAFGASATKLIRQLIAESSLIALLAAGGALLICIVGARWLVFNAPFDLGGVDFGVDGRLVALTLAFAAISGLVLGIAASLRAPTGEFGRRLVGGGRLTGGPGRGRLGALLVVGNLGLCVVLLVAAGLFLKSFVQLRNVQLGFEADDVLTARITLPDIMYSEEHQIVGFYDRLLESLRGHRGVESVAATGALPLTDSTGGTSFYPERSPVVEPGAQPLARYTVVSDGYFESLGIPVLRGRSFRSTDLPDARPVAVVSESLGLRYWPDRGPVGELIHLGLGENEAVEIIGMVGDVHDSALDIAPRPTVYLSHRQRPLSSGWVVLKATGDPTRYAGVLRSELRALDPSIAPSQMMPLTGHVASSLDSERFLAVLTSSFSTLTLMLAIAGMYGVMSFRVALRRRELGIRMALGAAPHDLFRETLGEGIRLTVVGLGLGLVLAMAIIRWTEALLFEVSAGDPTIFGSVLAGLAGVVLAAAYLPARRAARAEPGLVMRSE